MPRSAGHPEKASALIRQPGSKRAMSVSHLPSVRLARLELPVIAIHSSLVTKRSFSVITPETFRQVKVESSLQGKGERVTCRLHTCTGNRNLPVLSACTGRPRAFRLS